MTPFNLYAPDSFLNATCEERKRVCNGCGSAKAKFDFVPDSIWGLKIRSACDRHDWMYHIGKTIEHKEEADRVFLNNMLRLIEAKSHKLLKPLRRRRALKYYEAVVMFGGPAYWSNK
jgi:hypothetical protein